jgi:DNA-binding transcriptional LysR family regulator
VREPAEVRLLDRTPQGSRLTEAGEVFLPRAKALLRSAAQAAASTRAAATPGRITVGYHTNLFVTPAVRARRCWSTASTSRSPGCRCPPTGCA